MIKTKQIGKILAILLILGIIALVTFILITNRLSPFDTEDEPIYSFNPYSQLFLNIDLGLLDPISSQETYDLLGMMSYEMSYTAFFTADTVFDQINNNLHLYNLAWILSLLELYNI